MRWYMALAFVLALQMFMYIAQSQATELGSNYTVSQTASAHYVEYDGGNYTLNSDVMNFIPITSGAVDDNTGEAYTDSYRTGGTWLKDDGGKNANFITAPVNLMKDMGFGDDISFAFGVFWYLFVGSLVLYQFLRGGA